MKIIEKLNARLLEPTMSDEQLENTLYALSKINMPRVTLLPWQIPRGVQLMANSGMKIGSVVDFPLAAGTQAKLFYEVGQYFQLGADFLEVSLPAKKLLEQPEEILELMQQLQNLAVNWGELIFQVDTTILKVEEKMNLLKFIADQDAAFSLGHGLNEKQMNINNSVWNLGGNHGNKVQMNVAQPSTNQVHMLLRDGIHRVGINDWEQIDPDAEITLL